MKITSVECSATFNLGNFQSVRIGYTASVPDDNCDLDEVAACMAELRRLINLEAIDQGVKPTALLRE